MGQDAFGNYRCDMEVVFHQVAAVGGQPNLYGSGSPEGVVAGTLGNTYTNDDTGAFYVKTTASGNTGWIVVTGGGGGGASSGNGPPDGSTSGNLYIQWDTVPPNQLWSKNQDGTWRL